MNTITFLHSSDAHLGKFHRSMKSDPNTGKNLMTLDNEIQFFKLIDIAVENRVDFVVHSGDLFDRVNVRNGDIKIALQGIRKLADNGIPFLAISGNHDRPFTFGVSSPVTLLNYQENSYVFATHGTKVLDIHGTQTAIHGISYLKKDVDREFRDEINFEIHENEADYRIMMSHQSIEGFELGHIISYTNEPFITKKMIPGEISYAAMGHLHRRQTQNHIFNEEMLIHYPGSPNVMDFGERNDEKAASIVRLTGSQTEIEAIALNTRRFKEVIVKVENPDPKSLELILVEAINHNKKNNEYLGLRIQGKLLVTLHHLLLASKYREHTKNLAGFNIYPDQDPRLLWIDQEGESVLNEENWILEPKTELMQIIRSQGGIKDDIKAKLLVLGEEIIREVREG